MTRFFNPGEKNAMIERQRLTDAVKKFHIEVIDRRSSPAQDLPLDTFILANPKQIGTKLREAKIKRIGSLKLPLISYRSRSLRLS
jgi:hypothetical protein